MAYTDEQMAAALRLNGVPAGPAAVLVATSHPESSASNVVQQGQPYDTTGWGVWQITPGNSEPQAGVNNQLLTLSANAKAAAAKWRSQGLGAWTTVTSGKDVPYLQAAQAAVARVYSLSDAEVSALVKSAGSGGQPGPGTSGAGQSGGQQAELTSFLGSTSGVLGDAGALLHGAAIVLDRVFGLFAPGQGWRLVFWAAAAASGWGSYRAFPRGDSEDAGNLPLAILLLGAASAALFMAARPWPQTSGGPIRPGAYVIDVLEGQPPPPGPEAFSATEVHLTEAGLAALLAVWAAGKTGQALGGLAAGAGAAGGLFGKVWGWIKGLGGEAEGAAGDVASAGETV